MRDDELRAALADLGDRIDYPRTGDLSGFVMSRLRADEPRPSHHRLRALAIAAAVLMVAVLALPAPRHAVAEWHGFSTVRIVPVESVPPNTGTTLRLGREVPLDEAREATSFTVEVP